MAKSDKTNPPIEDAQAYIVDLLRAPEKIRAITRDVCVVFADLCGSTEFKRLHPGVDGLKKTVLHNAVAADVIRNNNGKVSKYLGDGVLAVFEGAESAANALKASAVLLRKIEEANAEQGWKDAPAKMETSVGIDSGEVVMFSFPESTTEDPQGNVVDIAARLSGLASAQQVVCTTNAYVKAQKQSKNNLNLKASKIVQRLIKGWKKPIDLRSICGESTEPKAITISAFERVAKDPEIERCATEINSVNVDDALSASAQLIDHCPDDFEVHLSVAGKLLIRNDVKRITKHKILGAAIQHLSLVQQTCPHSFRAWYLSSWSFFRKYELGEGGLEGLDEAVRHARVAFALAEAMGDGHSILVACTCLARKLSVRHEWEEGNDNSLLTEAAELCERVKAENDKIDHELRAEYLFTHAMVRLQSGDRDYEAIEGMIVEMRTLQGAQNLAEKEAVLQSAIEAARGKFNRNEVPVS